ncbi:hypothetical protein RN607_03870 [Demequina capsici]|uniref:Uncharacterized protein n=1 Tax=Demequina capsici TaxID=3075620 RepID=A0AA96FGM5_9MICO|nr:hypothetical protein [Demequina sp. PMTSA13]WNM28151.1 hypothetical protein RN607_03870 [Demequina sp. PMTSA13]
MTEPALIPQDALSSRRIALSVSESADLARLGLNEQHCRLVVAEVSRAIMLAGGTVVYGGHLGVGGYTEILIDEAQRFGGGRPVLEIALPESEYRKLNASDLIRADRRLGEVGQLTLVTELGYAVGIGSAFDSDWSLDAARALTAMRARVARETTARLIVGGRLVNYAGTEPGVIEEARLTVEADKLLLAAGGYGGASAAVARELYPQSVDGWFPQVFPAHADDPRVAAALDALRQSRDGSSAEYDLDEGLLRLLTNSHRPADIAVAAVRLLSGLAD